MSADVLNLGLILVLIVCVMLVLVTSNIEEKINKIYQYVLKKENE